MKQFTPFIRFTTFLIAVTLLTGMGQAQANTIADARGDFVPGINIGDPGILPATGTGTWRYLDSETANPTNSNVLNPLLWIALNSYRHSTSGGSSNNVDILNANLTPEEIRVHRTL